MSLRITDALGIVVAAFEAGLDAEEQALSLRRDTAVSHGIRCAKRAACRGVNPCRAPRPCRHPRDFYLSG